MEISCNLFGNAISLFLSNNLKKGMQFVDKNGVGIIDTEGNTLLHLACACANKDIVSYLLSKKADVEARNFMGWTPIMQAARYGHTCLIELLCSFQNAINVSNACEISPIMLAAASGNLETVRCLIEKGADIDTHCVMALMVAAHHGWDKILTLLLNKGVRANAVLSKFGITSLMFCVLENELSTAQLLLNRGANPMLQNSAGFSALQIAENMKLSDMVKLLKTKISRDSISNCLNILEAVHDDNISAVLKILQNDSSKSKEITETGGTPLMLAAILGHISIMKLLIDYGAVIDAKDFLNGWTALMLAIYYKQVDASELLIESGANIFTLSIAGFSSLDLAKMIADSKMIQILVKAEINNTSQHSALFSKGNSYFDYQGKEGTNKHSQPYPVHHFRNLWKKVFNKSHTNRHVGDSESIQDEGASASMSAANLYKPIFPQKNIYPLLIEHGLFDCISEATKKMKAPIISTCCDIPLPPGGKTSNCNYVQNAYSSQKLLSMPNVIKYRALSKMNTSAAEGSCDVLKNSHEIVLKSFSNSSDSKLISFPISKENEALNYLTVTLGTGKLTEVLKKLSLTEHMGVFDDQEIDIDAFVCLSMQDFKDLGINDEKEREKLYAAVQSLKKKVGAPF